MDIRWVMLVGGAIYAAAVGSLLWVLATTIGGAAWRRLAMWARWRRQRRLTTTRRRGIWTILDWVR